MLDLSYCIAYLIHRTIHKATSLFSIHVELGSEEKAMKQCIIIYVQIIGASKGEPPLVDTCDFAYAHMVA